MSVRQQNPGISTLQAVRKVIKSTEEERCVPRRRRSSSREESIESTQTNLQELGLQNSINLAPAVQPETEEEDDNGV